MNTLLSSVVLVTLTVGSAATASAGERHLSSSDLNEIKRVCRSLYGSPAYDNERWFRLRKYARTKDAVDHMVVICSAACEGSLQLIDDTEIYYSHANTPPKYPGYGHDRIGFVKITHHGKAILTLPNRNETAMLCDWSFIQSVGGISLGKPYRTDRNHILLPIECDVSGLRKVTIQPTTKNSGLVCEPVVYPVLGGRIYIAIETDVAHKTNRTSRCPPADLGPLTPGTYFVFYVTPDDGKLLGSIQVPQS